ncbi:spinster family MFS transporter [Novosphingobium rosa]|uniref:spinster family MFS transporter n=1 Tax=Novosphingobium rosa TaxID=76978 RepID=UPI001FE23F6C|nr:MFS transporter [Novosphingobium rosa]
MTVSTTATWAQRRTLFALFLVSTFNYIDRTILSLLQIPIKRELGLSDGQMGALTGLAFAIFYTTLSLPVARIADRGNRRWLIVASLLIWSTMTACSGLAAGFATLVFFRIGVAIGESGSIPASVSLIADFYPAQRRASAMATWGLALPTGLMLGYAGTGWLEERFGWRIAFALVGGAGVLLAPLVFALIREPGRPAATGEAEPALSFRQSVLYLWRSPAYRLAVGGCTLHAFSQYALMTWNAPFFVRNHGLSMPQVALLMALLSGFAGAAGMYLGGFAADRLSQRDIRWRVWMMALVIAVYVPATLIELLAPSLALSIAMATLVAAVSIAYYGPVLSVTQSLVPTNLRAMCNAVLLLVFNLFGLGLGPWLVGLTSDQLTAHFGAGENGLRYALSLSLLTSLASVAVLMLCAQAYRKEIAAKAKTVAGS